MVDWEATADGYSFAFIPKAQTYDEADLMIGVNIFKIRGLAFDEVITNDTVAVREHYGDNVSIWPVDSIFAASGQTIPTFFVNDPSRFLPNVMISYVNGESELLVFELVITERAVRMKAEDVFIECLEKLKVLGLLVKLRHKSVDQKSVHGVQPHFQAGLARDNDDCPGSREVGHGVDRIVLI